MPNGNARLIRPGRNSLITLWPGSVTYKRESSTFITPYLQDDLSLGVKFKYKFTFNISARNAHAQGATIPDGWYQLNMVVVRPERTRLPPMPGQAPPRGESVYARYVTHTTTFLQFTDHMKTQPIEFRFPNLSSTSIMNDLYIELIPLTENCDTTAADGGKILFKCISTLPNGEPDRQKSILQHAQNFVPYIVRIPFVPYISSDTTNTSPDGDALTQSLPFNRGLEAYVLAAKRLNALKPPVASYIAPKDYAHSNRLAYLSIHDPTMNQIGDDWMRGSGQTFKSALTRLIKAKAFGTMSMSEDLLPILPALCGTLARFNQQYSEGLRTYSNGADNMDLGMYMRSCLYKPDKLLRLARGTHIQGADLQNAKALVTESLPYNIQMNYIKSRSHSDDVTESWGVLGAALRVMDTFGKGLVSAIGVNLNISSSDSRSEIENSSASWSLPMDLNFVGMAFWVTDSQRCLEVQAIPAHNSPLFDSRADAPSNGLYICADPEYTPTLTNEIYTHVFVHRGETSIVDPYSPDSQIINETLQGDREISRFYYNWRNGITPEGPSRLAPFELHQGKSQKLTMPEGKENFFVEHGSNHSVIVNPISFPQEEAPSVAQKALGLYSERFTGDL